MKQVPGTASQFGRMGAGEWFVIRLEKQTGLQIMTGFPGSAKRGILINLAKKILRSHAKVSKQRSKMIRFKEITLGSQGG